MAKGAETRGTILRAGIEAAYEVGLGGVTIGELAGRTGMSKSGLFAHFGSKEGLQQAVLAQAREDFVADVVRPALASPRGQPRLCALFEHWLAAATRRDAGCCLFVKAATELDQQPGALRDQLVDDHRDLLETIASLVEAAVEEGHFAAGTDAGQFAHDLYGIQLSYYLAAILGDPEAEARTHRAFDALVRSVSVAPSAGQAAADRERSAP